jgi:DnaJ-class molecular chaperone
MWQKIKQIFKSKEQKIQEALGLRNIKCSNCNGTGEVCTFGENPSFLLLDPIKCDKCNGKGRIKNG